MLSNLVELNNPVLFTGNFKKIDSWRLEGFGFLREFCSTGLVGNA